MKAQTAFVTQTSNTSCMEWGVAETRASQGRILAYIHIKYSFTNDSKQKKIPSLITNPIPNGTPAPDLCTQNETIILQGAEYILHLLLLSLKYLSNNFFAECKRDSSFSPAEHLNRLLRSGTVRTTPFLFFPHSESSQVALYYAAAMQSHCKQCGGSFGDERPHFIQQISTPPPPSTSSKGVFVYILLSTPAFMS